ncbi:hypothetical protein [Lederbergia graminis]|uniref:Uncharacterized protein n=1 Tax=Lederbergia graminis TaxID=735518 RepID=A0ABW0LLL7_9BACI|nr:hypothetical protein [Paenibacillus bovis]
MIDFFDNGDAKLYEDRYQLYVNGDYIGDKTLKNMSDNLSDVDSFLKNKGFRQFKSQLEGDHYNIEASTDEAEGISDALFVYVNNR